MRTSSQLATMNALLENAHAIGTERIPIRASRARAAHAEPLACYCMAVLESRVSCVTNRHARMLRETLRNPDGIGADLLYPQQVVPASDASY